MFENDQGRRLGIHGGVVWRKRLGNICERSPVGRTGKGILRKEPRNYQGFVLEPVTMGAK